MHRLIVLIGVICLLPKVEMCYVEVVPSVANPKNEYWEEMCRTVFPEFGKNILEHATTEQKICYEREAEKLLGNMSKTGSTEYFAEAFCRVMRVKRKCDEHFFEDITPCLRDGEMEKTYKFVLELHENTENFWCTGSNTFWVTALMTGNSSWVVNEEKLKECISSGHCAEISEGLLAHARGGSADTFKSLYCA
ncbi:uncharacterized protein LOC124168271 isoform X2 [Ischnura elegans]|nr:uncharacterized protein LOC124168271 isoform X2 [Ischnura elegans]